MKELVTIEKDRYHALLSKEQELNAKNRKMQDLYAEISLLNKRLCELIMTKKFAAELTGLGDYVRD